MPLKPGEKGIWTGKPKQGFVMRKRDLALMPFSLVWCGFAIFWTWSATTGGAPLFFTLWGSMFICVGVYFVIGRFVHDAIIRSKTGYGITDKRIVISKRNREITIPIGEWSHLEKEDYPDGTGTISFAQPQGMKDAGLSIWVPSLDKTPQFFRIADCDKVMDTLISLNSKRQQS